MTGRPLSRIVTAQSAPSGPGLLRSSRKYIIVLFFPLRSIGAANSTPNGGSGRATLNDAGSGRKRRRDHSMLSTLGATFCVRSADESKRASALSHRRRATRRPDQTNSPVTPALVALRRHRRSPLARASRATPLFRATRLQRRRPARAAMRSRLALTRRTRRLRDSTRFLRGWGAGWGAGNRRRWDGDGGVVKSAIC